ncbi:MAG TPA: Wzz/FepE/Etk N-terminal domain-containing protein, partial [Patescibacteria group bacterium]|nr:Wzz/FepE/Etk N-terminal domain-containing protein [Patescibacteria group bacterium]
MNQVEARKESTIKDFLEVIFRRKWIIVGIVTVATAVAFIVNMREPAVYESSVKALVKRGEQPGVFSRSVQTLTWEEEISSQIEMVKSTIVADRAHELFADYAPAGYTPKAKINVNRVGAGVVGTSNVIWVAYSSDDPVFCEVAVNAIVNAYKEYYQRVRTPPEMEDFFSREMQTMKEEIEYWRERKERVATEWGIVDLQQQQLETVRSLGQYRRELEEVSQDLEEKESVVRYLDDLKARDKAELPTVTAGLLGAVRETAVERLRNGITDLRVRESELAVGYTGEHKKLREVREQLAEMERMLDVEIDAMLSINKTQIEIMRSRQQYLRDMVQRFEEESRTYPEKEVELERIHAALLRVQENYNRLVEQHMASKVALASNPEWNVTILNPASPGYRKKTRDYVRMALGPVFSLIVALGFAFFIDNLDHSI